MKNNFDKNEPLKTFGIKTHTYRQIIATIPGCIMAFGTGMTFGISAVLLPQLRQDQSIYYNPTHESWIASVSSLAMVVGSLSSGHILDHYGRKMTHTFMGIPFIIGWIIMACAPSTNIIILARLLTGLTSGTIRAVLLVYFGEIASPKIRALLLPLPGLMFNLGTLLTHVIGHYLYWKSCAVVCIFPAVLVVISSLLLRESPLWLITRGQIDEGMELFRWFRGSSDGSEAELKAILRKQSENTANTHKLKHLCTSAVIKPMLITLVIMTNIQFSGVNAIGFYAQDIFQHTFSGSMNPFIIMVVMDCIVGLVSVCICFLGKYVPKKKIYLISNFGVFVFTLGLVICLIVGCDNFEWVPLVCLVFYLCFGTNILIIGWTFVPELLPSNARGLGSGINSAFSYILLFTIAKVTPDFIRMFGAPAMFAVIGCSTFVCGIILLFILPDTDGKTLQCIEDGYNKKPVHKINITNK